MFQLIFCNCIKLMLYNIIICSIESKLCKKFHLYSNKFKIIKFKTIKPVAANWSYKLIKKVYIVSKMNAFVMIFLIICTTNNNNAKSLIYIKHVIHHTKIIFFTLNKICCHLYVFACILYSII